MQRSRASAFSGGFTLLEVVVALVVLAVVLTSVLRLGQGSLRAVDTRERQVALHVLADTALGAARLGREDDLGTAALPMPDGIAWRVERLPLEAHPAAEALRDTGVPLGELDEELDLLRVTVEDEGGASAVLESLALKASGS